MDFMKNGISRLYVDFNSSRGLLFLGLEGNVFVYIYPG